MDHGYQFTHLDGVFITLITYKFRKKPIIVFVLSCIISGLLEFTIGYLLFNIKGIRLWDYNTEIWNFGNVGGYICLRSIMFFGISGLFLMYIVIPLFKKFASKLSNRALYIITVIPALIFLIDIIVSGLKIL